VTDGRWPRDAKRWSGADEMADPELEVAGERVAPATGWTMTWLDPALGLVRLTDGQRTLTVLVEGSGSERVVTLRGRRIPVTARSWRERMLAETEASTRGRAGPVVVVATLPGRVVTVSVAAGQPVSEGDPLVTLEAMKMQNEIRAPRAGTVSLVHVEAGQRVMAGDPILRID